MLFINVFIRFKNKTYYTNAFYTIDKKFSLRVSGDMTKQGSDFGYCVTFTKRTTFIGIKY